MSLIERDGSTICAPITASGRAGIAVIRVSGPQSFEITRKLAPFLPESIESHRTYYGRIKDQVGEVDEVLVTCFAQGRSFTGEATAEISLHGNPEIVSLVMAQLQNLGALVALPGEFTFRAFFNGRIDLIQAEGILSLIQASHEKAVRLSLRQIQGRLSNKLIETEDHLTWILANIEAGIDFSTEDIDPIERNEIQRRADIISGTLSQLSENYHKMRNVTEGLRVLFLGQPNVGKSSLLNRLMESQRAIVTEVPGTTRDLIEGQIRVANGLVTLIDSAGLRKTEDKIENLGIEAALEEAKNVDIIVYLVDSRVGLSEQDRRYLEQIQNQKLIIGTKADLGGALSTGLQHSLSSLSGAGIEELKAIFNEILGSATDVYSEPVLRARQNEQIRLAADRLSQGLELLHQNASLEFVALELREALLAVYELLGKKFDDQIMDRVFSEFCIGK